jgi:acyl carrier protein
MDGPTCQQLKELLVEELNIEHVTASEIDDGAPLFGPDGLGLDSLDGLQIVTAIEERYGVKVPFEGEDARKVLASVASITDYVRRHLPAKAGRAG